MPNSNINLASGQISQASLTPEDRILLFSAKPLETITVIGTQPPPPPPPVGDPPGSGGGGGNDDTGLSGAGDNGWWDPSAQHDPNSSTTYAAATVRTAQGDETIFTSAKDKKTPDSNHHPFGTNEQHTTANGGSVSSSIAPANGSIITGHFEYSSTTYSDGTKSHSVAGDLSITPPSQLSDLGSLVARLGNDFAAAAEKYLGLPGPKPNATNSFSFSPTSAYTNSDTDPTTLQLISQDFLNEVAADIADTYFGGIPPSSASTSHATQIPPSNTAHGMSSLALPDSHTASHLMLASLGQN